MTQNSLVIRSTIDLVSARMMARNLASTLGFPPIDQVRIITAVNELAGGFCRPTGSGTVTLREVAQAERTGIEIIYEGPSPGGARPESAAGDAAPRGGIAEARRLMDTFEVQPKRGGGMTVICRKWRT